ncbi:MAG TPA: peptidase S41, partial [Saprospiraceae bacterium]|nr:peptidase S41 [Saprospiraceae bacterium]
MTKSTFALVAFTLFCSFINAQTAPLWLRYPAISPDGKFIAFSYQGDLWRVNTEGGPATRLTVHDAYDFMPVWSHDGQWIAFASDRYGNFDVFVMPAAGGPATRLTTHSAGDFPSDFTYDDQAIVFTSSRLDAASNQQFPSGVLSELYKVPLKGGMAKQMLTTPAENARFSADGKVMVFQDRKGYEDNFRKHHTSSVTRDVWKYDLNTNKYTQLSAFEGEDRNPVFAPNQQDIYYLSEANGSFNVFKMNLNNPAKPKQLTSFEKHPIRYLSAGKNGTICFSYNGELYTMQENSRPQKVAVQIAADSRYN